jgi:hypothetical protein
MLRTALAASAILIFGASGTVLAQNQTETPAVNGTIQSVDQNARTVVLDNGQTYTLSESADIDSLQQGSKVNLSCDSSDANCMVVTSGTQNDLGPESETQPSAGSNDSNTMPDEPTTEGSGASSEGGANTDGGSSSGSGSN